MAKMTKGRKIQIEDLTAQKLPDGTRKYKMFKTTDEESKESVDLSRLLLRHIDRNMLDAMTYQEKDKDGNILGSEMIIYTRDDDKGDIIFTIAATYLSKKDDEIREENDSLNEGTTQQNQN